ncbi:hypothetical protein IT413_06350 [Candidatus Peregrinibacteria bacterium]|nr:hypothetical protein [Candidatus Peregrinibacteria bacterium]
MSESDPLLPLPEVSSREPSNLSRRASRSSDRSIFDGLRKKLMFAAGVGLTSGALGGAFGTQGCLPAESETDSHESNEKVGSVQQAQWKATSFTPSWGQSLSNNFAPKVYWKTPTDGIAVFESDKGGGSDIYISTTSSGPTGPWSPETLIDDSGSVVKVNILASTESERGAVICVGGACATGKLIFSSDRDGSDDLFWGDFDTTTLAVTNVSKLPVGGTKVNGNFTGEMYPTVDFSGNKLFFNRDSIIYSADIGVWDKTALTGAVGAQNYGPSVYGTYLISSNDSGCANVSSSVDACRYDLSGTTLSVPTNANSIPGTLATPNDAQEQHTPYVDSKGYLWVSSGTDGNRTIKAFEPVAGTPDAGADSGEAGAGGADSGTDGSGGEGGTGGADAGTPDVDAGMDAALDAADDVMDSGTDASSDAGEGGTDAGSMDAGTDASSDAGEVDAGMDASTDAGEGGTDAGSTDAGTDASSDAGEVDAGMDASTDAGEGGTDAGKPADCAIKVESGPGEVTCDSSGSFITMKITAENQEVKFVGPQDGCYVIATKLPSAEGDSITYNGALSFPAGVAHHVKNVNHCYSKGTIAGLDAFYEGTEPVASYKPEYNKDGAKVVTIKLAEGQIRYEHKGKPIQSISFPEEKCLDGKPCEPGQQPQNTEVSVDLKLYSKAKLDDLPVVTPEAPADGGCSVTRTPEETSNGILAAFAALGIAGLIRRRQKQD